MKFLGQIRRYIGKVDTAQRWGDELCRRVCHSMESWRKGAESCMTGHDRRRVQGCSVLVEPTKIKAEATPSGTPNSHCDWGWCGMPMHTGPIVHLKRTSSNKRWRMKSTQTYRKTFKVKAVCSQSALNLDIVPALFVAVRPT